MLVYNFEQFWIGKPELAYSIRDSLHAEVWTGNNFSHDLQINDVSLRQSLGFEPTRSPIIKSWCKRKFLMFAAFVLSKITISDVRNDSCLREKPGWLNKCSGAHHAILILTATKMWSITLTSV
ncbi:MAG: hypothetical protein R3B47_13025 [Bacteroidia bacterium]